jgi:hypothetical protein
MPHYKHTENSSAIRRAISISPDMQVKAKIGAIWTTAVTLVTCAIICTAYAVRMESKLDTCITNIQKSDAVMDTVYPQHVIMWNDYSKRPSLSMLKPKVIPNAGD